MQHFLGIDYGEKKIGLALADERSMVAVYYGIMKNDRTLWPTLRDIMQKERITHAIIGMPLNLKSEETAQTQRVKAFCNDFVKRFPKVTLAMQDERYTSKIASKAVGSANDDASSAVLILEGYLDYTTSP